MALQCRQLAFQGFRPIRLSLSPDSQALVVLQLAPALGQRLPGLRQRSGFVVLAFVLQFPEPVLQSGDGGAVVPGGYQLIQPLVQGLIPAHRQVPAPEKAPPEIHASLHPQ